MIGAKRTRRRGARLVAGLLLALGVMLGIVEAAGVIQGWYLEGRRPEGAAWIWLALLPVWLGVYLRYFSILRKDCDVCVSAREQERDR